MKNFPFVLVLPKGRLNVATIQGGAELLTKSEL